VNLPLLGFDHPDAALGHFSSAIRRLDLPRCFQCLANQGGEIQSDSLLEKIGIWRADDECSIGRFLEVNGHPFRRAVGVDFHARHGANDRDVLPHPLGIVGGGRLARSGPSLPVVLFFAPDHLRLNLDVGVAGCIRGQDLFLIPFSGRLLFPRLLQSSFRCVGLHLSLAFSRRSSRGLVLFLALLRCCLGKRFQQLRTDAIFRRFWVCAYLPPLQSVGDSSSTVPSGSVISESPTAGTLVNGGTSVNLVVSFGVAVPNVVGATQSAATSALTSAGLVLGTVTTASTSTVPSGSVISESPTAGTLVNGGTSVNLVVSSGVAVPNVVGTTQSAATSAITSLGLVPGTVNTASSSTVPSGSVISESPAAGTLVNGGTLSQPGRLDRRGRTQRRRSNANLSNIVHHLRRPGVGDSNYRIQQHSSERQRDQREPHSRDAG